jgi:exodeoxyribonuclease V alpha subunit
MTDPQTTWTELSGTVERITYGDPDSGFTIAQLRVPGQPDLITAVGQLMSPALGTILKLQGQWTDHPRFGRQFRIAHFRAQVPVTQEGIRKYLGSGLVKGIGPTMAERIVDRFGDSTLDVLENHPQRLNQVNGIGPKRVDMIRRAWEEQKEIRSVMLFLQSHSVSATYATRIYKQYGQQTVSMVQENPYRLAGDIFGIGFLTADRIAGHLGFAKDSPLRLEAGVLHVLYKLSDEGHVYYPYGDLMEKAQQILAGHREAIAMAIEGLASQKKIVIEDMQNHDRASGINAKAVFLALFHACESLIAQRLRLLQASPPARPPVNTTKALAWVQQRLDLKLADRQARAVCLALKEKMLVITGGPGTGKTTIIRVITQIYERMRSAIQLAAPTGRAAKRLSQATGLPAKTIHRLLEYSFVAGGFQRNENNPIRAEVLIVDEASMIDTLLMNHLLLAIPLPATLILVGDVNQLPSVGPGNILKDIISSGVVPVIALNEIFRQARASQIIVNAHRMINGQLPLLVSEDTEKLTDFYFVEQPDPDKILDIILTLTSDRIPKRFGFDPINDIQVLTPMHRGVIGAGNLNRRLQELLNPQDVCLTHGEQAYRLHDKVMQIRNNYEKEVFNGDLGRIEKIDAADKTVTIRFEERLVAYEFGELDEIVLAYAVSVHKSQGSEYPAVVIPVATQHYVLLQRNLIYTAVTRARRLTVLVGTRRALAIAIKNDDAGRRYTRLKQRLNEATGIVA